MEQIKIQESPIKLKHGKKGKLAVLMYLGEGDPVTTLDEAVRTYVQREGYNEFIDINMDNPWIRVIISDINDMNQEDFNRTKHRLKP